MQIARKTSEYFEKPSQSTEKLLNIQASGSLERYVGKTPMKTIQDVVTRWWSTYRMCKRLRWLKHAIMALHCSEEVDCEMLSDEQWTILHQIEITLQTMAGFQRMLEGECYVTGSMVTLAVFRVRRAYMTVIDDVSTLAPVKYLAGILLDDFNKRYEPADYSGRVRYTGNADIGHRKRYTGVHPYFFVASLLDPRIKGLLFCPQDEDDSDDENDADDGDEYLMTEAEYTQLKSDVLDRMVAKKKEMIAEAKGEQKNQQPTTGEKEAEPVAKVPPLTNMQQMMYGGMARVKTRRKTNSIIDDGTIRLDCERELKGFLECAGSSIYNDDMTYTNPLKWWKKNQGLYPVLAALAKVFLTIPATSAPSERVWSQSANVITTKRARLDETIASGIMFVKENVRVLRKHYTLLTKNDKNALPLAQSGIPVPDDELVMDVGQDLFSHNLFF